MKRSSGGGGSNENSRATKTQQQLHPLPLGMTMTKHVRGGTHLKQQRKRSFVCFVVLIFLHRFKS